jgi:hypothetical protein
VSAASYSPAPRATAEQQLARLRELARGSRWAARILSPEARCVGEQLGGGKCGSMPTLVLYGRPYCETHARRELADG